MHLKGPSNRLPGSTAAGLVAGLLICSCFGSPTEPLREVPGFAREHEVVTETRQLSGIRGVLLPILADLEIEQGATESLWLETDKSMMPSLHSDVRGNGILEFWIDDELLQLPTLHAVRIDLRLTVRNLETIEVAGSGAIRASSLDVERLSLRSSAAGYLTLSELNAKSLEAEVAGTKPITVSGWVDKQIVRLAERGDYAGSGLESAEAEVRLSGSGSATVRVKDRLVVTITGSGCVRYLGSPAIENTIPGSGCVEQIAG